MEIKKNPNIDPGRNTALYFALGLALMSFLAYTTVNWKKYDRSDSDMRLLNLDQEDIEEDVFFQQPELPPPPPPPPAPPEEIEVIEDEEEIEEDIVETSESDQEEEIVEVEDVEVEEFEEDVEVPFTVVEDAPIFPGCEKEKNNEARKKCMSQKISRHVNRKFDIGLAEELGLSGRQRINVIFKINKNGDIVEVRSRAPHPRLETEADKVIKSLPKMKPGRQRGKPVTVQYALPISFVIQ
ncbi:MAG: energy transducer TonB [Flavobacteriaceae bacterium]|mgnify:FL=1|nr:energy transducer TonB [Flavobacteriaceae bacterium]|tara:strand:- start:2398 stop:3117 length:720 start_codon:yes stop_codon:yes gene_type:complete